MFGIHSNYSLLDGKASIGELGKKLKAKGWNYFALSDTDNFSGAIDLTKESSKIGLKQIFGIEFILTEELEINSRNNANIRQIEIKIEKAKKIIDKFKAFDKIGLRDQVPLIKFIEGTKEIIVGDNVDKFIKSTEKEFGEVILNAEKEILKISESGTIIGGLPIDKDNDVFITHRELYGKVKEDVIDMIMTDGESAFESSKVRNALIRAYKSLIQRFNIDIKNIGKNKEDTFVESETRSKVQIYAKNWHGLASLIKLNHVSQEYNEDGVGRLNKELIFEHGNNILVMFDGIHGPLQRAIGYGQLEKAESILKEFKEKFGEDLYQQFQPHKHKANLLSAKIIYDLCKNNNVKGLITTAPRIISSMDIEPRKHKLCKKYKLKLSQINNLESLGKSYLDAPHIPTYEVYNKDELFELSKGIFNFMPDDIIKKFINENDEASLKAEPFELRSSKRMPIYETPNGETQEEYLTHLCEKKLEEMKETSVEIREKYGDYKEILKDELEIINKLKFAGYFLITKEIADYCKEYELFGAGRGSAAGSLVGLLTGITSIIDPIKENQMFERFLSYGRAKGVMYGIHGIDKGIEGSTYFVSNNTLISGEGEADISYKYGKVFSFEHLFNKELEEKKEILNSLGIELGKKDSNGELVEILDQLDINKVKNELINFFDKELGFKVSEKFDSIDHELQIPISKGETRIIREMKTLLEDQPNDLVMFYVMHKLGIKFYNKSNFYIAELLGITTDKKSVEDMEFLMIGTYDYVDIDVDRPSFEERDEVYHFLRKRFGSDKVSSIGTFFTFQPASSLKQIMSNYGETPLDSNMMVKDKKFDTLENAPVEGFKNKFFYLDSTLKNHLIEYYSSIFNEEFKPENIENILEILRNSSSYNLFQSKLVEDFGLTLKDGIDTTFLRKLLKIEFLEEKGEWRIKKEIKKQILEDLFEENKDQKNVEELINYLEKNENALTSTINLLGNVAAIGQHAGGILISDIPLSEYIPISGKHKSDLKTGWIESSTGKQLTFVGAIKFDVLKLKSLNICMEAEKKAGRDPKAFFDMDIYNKETFEKKIQPLIEKQLYSGIFQIGDNASARIIADKMLRNPLIEKGVKLSFNDLAAMSAANRPGPISFETVLPNGEEIKGASNYYYGIKIGLIEENYFGSKIAENLLSETRGMVLYQEQSMKLGQQLGGFNEFEANKFRKEVVNLGKFAVTDPRWQRIYDKWYNKMMDGALKPKYKINHNGKLFYGPIRRLEFLSKTKGFDLDKKELYEEQMTPENAETLLRNIMAMAAYTFNSAHSKSYAALTMRMLVLKSEIPTSFAATLLDMTKITPELIDDIEKQGISIQKPDINISSFGMASVEKDKNIFWGLDKIKGAGDSIKYIEEARNVFGEIKSIAELFIFVPKKHFSKRAVMPFMKVGAFSNLSENHKNRRALLEYYSGDELKLTEFKVKKTGPDVEVRMKSKLDTLKVPKIPSVFEIFDNQKDFNSTWKKIRVFNEGETSISSKELKEQITKDLEKEIQISLNVLSEMIESMKDFYKDLEEIRDKEKEILGKLSSEIEDYSNKEIRIIEEDLTEGFIFSKRIYTPEQVKIREYIKEKEGTEYIGGEITNMRDFLDKKGNRMAFLQLKDLNDGKTKRLVAFSSSFNFIKEKLGKNKFIAFKPQDNSDGDSIFLGRSIIGEKDFIRNINKEVADNKSTEFVIKNTDFSDPAKRRINMQIRKFGKKEEFKFGFGILNAIVIKKQRKTGISWMEAEISYYEYDKNKQDIIIIKDEVPKKEVFIITGKLLNLNRRRAKEGKFASLTFTKKFNYDTRKNVLMVEAIDIFN